MGRIIQNIMEKMFETTNQNGCNNNGYSKQWL